MRWLRSWPAVEPANRAHVVDDLPRFVMTDYDYSALGELHDDICLLEWDMACTREDRERFEWYAQAKPDEITVAPYKLYEPSSVPPHWAHRTLDDNGEEHWLQDGEHWADYVSFGMIYLPLKLVRAFLYSPAPERGRPPHVPHGSYNDTRLHDQTFSVWYAHRWRGPQIYVTWDCRPVHLHY